MEEYEFEAPKFVNFMEQNTNTPDIDKWFDARDGTPNSVKHKIATQSGPAVKELTIPEPFKFHTTNKKPVQEPAGSPYVPLALKVKAFETNTPERFKKKPGKALKRDLSKLTFPKSPYLRTRKRTHSRAIPTQEKELAELAQIRPFKAKPVPERILKGPQKVKLASMELTVPQSPAITKPKIKRLEPSPEKIIKANPVPNLQKAFAPCIVHRVIEPLEFELPGESIRKAKKDEFDSKVRTDELEMIKKREFKARPLPHSLDAPMSLPAVQMRTLTEPVPFKLDTDKRGEIHRAHFNEKLEHEMQKEMEMKEFVANPLPESRPWIPDLSDKKMTVPDTVVLKTDIRAAKRQEFDELLKQKEEEENIAKENQLKMQMEVEQEIVKKLRKESVHQAQPIRNFVPVVVHPSTKPLTVPESPAIGKKRSKKL